jgi:hypothetical protein
MTPDTIPWADEPEGGGGMTWGELAGELLTAERDAWSIPWHTPSAEEISALVACVKSDICRDPYAAARKAFGLWAERVEAGA